LARPYGTAIERGSVVAGLAAPSGNLGCLLDINWTKMDNWLAYEIETSIHGEGCLMCRADPNA
jgi:hypothetical protein